MPYATKEKKAEHDRHRDKAAKYERDKRWRKKRMAAGGCPKCYRMMEPELDGDLRLCSDCHEGHIRNMRMRR